VPAARPIQSQFTYAEVVRSLVDDKPADYGIKVLKQRLQVGNDLTAPPPRSLRFIFLPKIST